MATSPVVGQSNPLPLVSNLAGFPTATAAIAVRGRMSPLPQFVGNSPLPTPSPLRFIPVQPLPGTILPGTTYGFPT